MQSIDDIIIKSINPFDNIYYPHVTDIYNNSESSLTYIHQENFTKIETLLTQVSQDHLTRSILITGNSGCGKTYLLNQLKNKLSYKVFFVNVPPFAKRDSIWRRVLRYTVDNLIKNKTDKNNLKSPLFLYLSATKTDKDNLLGFLRNEKQKFINKLKEKYKKVTIHNPDDFFGVLYELTNPELYDLACKYMRGDALTEESLASLGVEKSINTETTARETLKNLSLIFCEIQPIILCFNQIESIAKLPNGEIDLDALLKVNAKIREDNKNFLIVISINTHTLQQHQELLTKSYPHSIDQTIKLENVGLAQAELTIGSRLEILHKKANYTPNSLLYPFNRQLLEKAFPIGKITFRDIAICGHNLFNSYKKWLLNQKRTDFVYSQENQSQLETISYFKVRWYEEFSSIQRQIKSIPQLSSTELTQMLQDALLALQMEEVKICLFIRSKYASYSLSYKLPKANRSIGIVWTEDANLESFFYVMEACRKILEKNQSLKLYLLRSQPLGNNDSKGYKVYKDIFVKSSHHYIIPDLHSVHYLATYHSLVKTAREDDLVIGNQIISIHDLQALLNTTNILADCSLLQNLGIIAKSETTNQDESGDLNAFKPMKKQIIFKEAKDYILNLVATQFCLSRQVLLQKAVIVFPHAGDLQLDGLIQQLCWENKIKILSSKADPSMQLVMLFPKK
ncbi:MAG: ATP-binding protein [Sphaerospermopsis sp. SIO1G1]|nr:ATP-binding protein [Sphaerospermopsis sp. SIO1G1]